MNTPEPLTPKRAWVPFAYGFRPFFLLSGLYAVVAIALWVATWPGGRFAIAGAPAMFWHGHEMVFGFIGAAIAGFMLTAVPSWTGQRGFAGRPLMLLVFLWLAGRAVFLAGDAVPFALLAVAELAFLPGVVAMVGPSLARTANRNRPLIIVLSAFWLLDAAFLYGLGTGNPLVCMIALRGAIGGVLVLITVIGGRIVPAFTGNALRAAGVEATLRSPAGLGRATIGATLAWAIAAAFSPLGVWAALLAAVAAALHLARMAGWQGWRTGRMPIVWILHLAYAWLPVGLALHAVFIATGAPWAAHWLHALGAGAAGMMILAVMTRAALGHTGRPLRVSGAIVVAYSLLLVAVLVRVFAAVIPGLAYPTAIHLAGGLWVLSFGLFVITYTPVLLLPRVDGKPG